MTCLRVGCAFSESLPYANSYTTTRVCFLRVTTAFPFPRIEWLTTQASSLPTYMSPFSHTSSQQVAMSSWSGDDASVGPAVWTEQDPEFRSNFPVLGKRDLQSMRDVRSYAPNQPVNWPRCAHGEFCVMQVYQGWNNSGRRF